MTLRTITNQMYSMEANANESQNVIMQKMIPISQSKVQTAKKKIVGVSACLTDFTQSGQCSPPIIPLLESFDLAAFTRQFQLIVFINLAQSVMRAQSPDTPVTNVQIPRHVVVVRLNPNLANP